MQVLLVLELLVKGDLRQYLLKMKTDNGMVGVNDHCLLKYCQEIVAGMTYLSSKAFVHRDLAARNVLVSSDNICKVSYHCHIDLSLITRMAHSLLDC